MSAVQPTRSRPLTGRRKTTDKVMRGLLALAHAASRWSRSSWSSTTC